MGTEQKGGVPQESPENAACSEAFAAGYEAAIAARETPEEAMKWGGEAMSRRMQRDFSYPPLPGTRDVRG